VMEGRRRVCKQENVIGSVARSSDPFSKITKVKP